MTSKGYPEAVEALRVVYPGATKAAISYAMHTKRTGVTFTGAARDLLRGILFPKRRKENRKNPCRWVFRLTEAQSEALTAVQWRHGFQTRQELMQFIITKILEVQNEV